MVALESNQRVNAQGRRVTISTLAASLVDSARGSNGLCGIFVAEAKGAEIIAASFRGAIARKSQKQKQAASATISARIRGRMQRREYTRLRYAALVVQRYAHGWLSRVGTRRLLARRNWSARMCALVTAFIEACLEHDVDSLKELCSDSIVFHVELAGGIRSYTSSGISAVANRVRQHNITAVTKPPYVQHVGKYEYEYDRGACTIVRQVMVGREIVREEYDVSVVAGATEEKVIRHLHAFERDDGYGQGGEIPEAGLEGENSVLMRSEVPDSLAKREQPPQGNDASRRSAGLRDADQSQHDQRGRMLERRVSIGVASSADLTKLARKGAHHVKALSNRLHTEQTGDSLETLAALRRQRDGIGNSGLVDDILYRRLRADKITNGEPAARNPKVGRLPPLSPSIADPHRGQSTPLREAAAFPLSASMPALQYGASVRAKTAGGVMSRQRARHDPPRQWNRPPGITMQGLLAERSICLMSGALSPTRRSKAALTRHLQRIEYAQRIETSGRWIGLEPTFRSKYSSLHSETVGEISAGSVGLTSTR